MKWREPKTSEISQMANPKGFDDYDFRLGDILRGERATLGKSLLDVEKETKIKANYIAAIENCDPTVFESQAFIAGSVRSYARYLELDPDIIFTACSRSKAFKSLIFCFAISSACFFVIDATIFLPGSFEPLFNFAASLIK